MKKKINENSTRSPYKKRKQNKEKEKKEMPRKCTKQQNNFNTKYNLICNKLMCFSVTTKLSLKSITLVGDWKARIYCITVEKTLALNFFDLSHEVPPVMGPLQLSHSVTYFF